MSDFPTCVDPRSLAAANNRAQKLNDRARKAEAALRSYRDAESSALVRFFNALLAAAPVSTDGRKVEFTEDAGRWAIHVGNGPAVFRGEPRTLHAGKALHRALMAQARNVTAEAKR